MLCINYLYMWVYFLIYRNRCVTRWDSLMPSFIPGQQISTENLYRQCQQILGLSQSSKDKISTLELKFSLDRIETSRCICEVAVSVLILDAKEENGAEHEERLIDSITYWAISIDLSYPMYWDSFYTLSMLGGIHLYNYDNIALELRKLR